jgi:hypothetical protein
MISEKIKRHLADKSYVKITRTVSKGVDKISNGYILDYSKNFVLIQETSDFAILGYYILPIDQIKKIRHNKYDKCYHKIMIAEGEADKVGISYKIDLDNWKSIFKSIKDLSLNVIVRCESPKIDRFNIGPIIKATKSLVYIQYFDPTGLLEENPTSINYQSITKVNFDDRYINVFSKYLRKKKSK